MVFILLNFWDAFELTRQDFSVYTNQWSFLLLPYLCSSATASKCDDNCVTEGSDISICLMSEYKFTLLYFYHTFFYTWMYKWIHSLPHAYIPVHFHIYWVHIKTVKTFVMTFILHRIPENLKLTCCCTQSYAWKIFH